MFECECVCVCVCVSVSVSVCVCVCVCAFWGKVEMQSPVRAKFRCRVGVGQ